MFLDAKAFNKPIGSWNTSNVTDMSHMFAHATSFNQNINSWNTGNVTDMRYMFDDALAFNQPLNLWNTSNVTNMSYMFYECRNFNQNLGNWNVSKLTNATNMCYNVRFCYEKYDSLLIGWVSKGVSNGVQFSATRSRFTNVSSAARDTLSNKGWTITDAGFYIKKYADAACDGYLFNETYLTNSGDYYEESCFGKDSLTLTIHRSKYDTLRVTTCDPYEWKGITYTDSGEYTDYQTTLFGCDSISTLFLTKSCIITGSDPLLSEEPSAAVYASEKTIYTKHLKEGDSLELLNLEGKVIYTGNESKIDLMKEKSGLYMVKLVSSSGVKIYKIYLF